MFLKVSSASEFGPAFYAEFINRGVTGMDLIDGKDASEFRDKAGLAKILNRKRYGRNFGHKLYATALRKLKSAEVVEDAITDYFVKLRSGQGMGGNLQEGTPLKTAEGYAITGVIRTGFDILKKKRRERPTLVRRDESGGESQIDIDDPSAFKDFAAILTVRDMEKAMREVEHYDERAAFWIQQMLRGWKDKEISEYLGLKHPQQLYELKTKVWGPKLRSIFEKYRRKVM